MGRNRVVAATAGLVAALGTFQSVQAQAPPPPIVTVSPFSVARGWSISDKDGGAMAHELAVRLVESGRYRVLDSAWLTGPGESKRPMPASFRAAARDAGVDYVIVGRLEKFTETYAIVQPGPRRLPPFGRPQMAWAAAPARTMTRRREFLRVTTEIVDAKSGEVLTAASTYCGPSSGSGLARAALLERALTSITAELLRWNPSSNAVFAGGNR